MATRRTKRSLRSTVYVSIEGDDDLKLALSLGKKQLDREVEQELGRIGEGVAARAREIAEEKGLVKTHRLVESVVVETQRIRVLIGDTARNPRDSYPYPGRLEFGDLDKPFLQPALASQEAEGLRRMRALLDRAMRTIAAK